MKKFFNDILTVRDNQTFCIVRVGIFSSLIVIFTICIIEAIRCQPINLLEFAGAVSTILGVGSFGIKVKLTDEPGGTHGHTA